MGGCSTKPLEKTDGSTPVCIRRFLPRVCFRSEYLDVFPRPRVRRFRYFIFSAGKLPLIQRKRFMLTPSTTDSRRLSFSLVGELLDSEKKTYIVSSVVSCPRLSRKFWCRSTNRYCCCELSLVVTTSLPLWPRTFLPLPRLDHWFVSTDVTPRYAHLARHVLLTNRATVSLLLHQSWRNSAQLVSFQDLWRRGRLGIFD